MSVTDTLATIQRQITAYVYSLYLIFGLSGCLLSILLLSRRQLRTVSCCIYFLTASVMMLINLLIGIVPTVYSLNNFDLTNNVLVFCKIRIYLLQSSSMMYRWLLMMACFDRYALSSVNVQLRNWAQVHLARRTVLIIIVVWLILPIHAPIFYHLRVGGCGIFNNQVAALYHSIFTALFGSVLPILMMFICALLVHHNLRVKRRIRESHRAVQRSSKSNGIDRVRRVRDQQILLMLLLQAFVFGITIIPLMIMNFYNAITLNYNASKSAEQLAIERFLFNIVEVIIFLYPVSSFYLYMMVSKIFRSELKRLLLSIFLCKCWKSVAQIQPSTNDIRIQTLTTQPVKPH